MMSEIRFKIIQDVGKSELGVRGGGERQIKQDCL